MGDGVFIIRHSYRLAENNEAKPMAELYCDICGNGPVRAQILVEGAKILACGRCMRSGKVLHRFEDDSGGAPPPAGGRMSAAATEEIIDDCGKAVRAAREKAGLPLAVVAERISEKESYLHAIESGRLAPTMEVARKLEKELGIRLVEKVAGAVAGGVSGAASRPFSEPTLGDMIDTKKKKGK